MKSRIQSFFAPPDRAFLPMVLSIGLPIALQNFIISSFYALDVFMIGSLGETAIAAVGIANQIYFLLILLLFGISSGAGIFTAQFWGKKDVLSIRMVLGLCLIAGCAVSMVFTAIAIFLPEQAMGVYSKDPGVVASGALFLRISGFGYLLNAISFCYTFILRSVHKVKLALVASLVSLGLNAFLNWILIFGHLGFPAYGVMGAGIATLVARAVEVLIILGGTYYWKYPAAATFREMTAFTRPFVRSFFWVTLPVILNEGGWALGVMVYNVIYAHMGTGAIAAINIAGTVDRLAFVLLFGLSNACAVMIGNKIGAREFDLSISYARYFLKIGVFIAIATGLAVIGTRGYLLSIYRVSPEVRLFASYTLLIFSFMLWSKVINLLLIVGIFRSGGDTRFSFFVDVSGVWLIGIPAGLLAAFVLGLPVYLVYLFVCFEEFYKNVLGLRRFYQFQWISDVTAAQTD